MPKNGSTTRKHQQQIQPHGSLLFSCSRRSAGAAPGSPLRVALDGAQFSFALTLPGFGAPVARGKAGRLVRRQRWPIGLKPPWHGNQFRLCAERRPFWRKRHKRRQFARGRLGMAMRRIRGQAGIGGRDRELRLIRLKYAGLRSNLLSPGDEIVDQLVQASLTA